MTHDDVLFGYRLRLFTLAEELDSVSEACRQMGVARSTYYAWKPRLERYGLDGLRVRERRRPRMPNQIGPHLEHRIVAFSLGHPGFGARRISAELARPKWGGIEISEHGIWRVLRRFNLNTRSKRLALIARHADPYERKPDPQPQQLHIEATEPGEKVQMDCFYVGRLSGSKGVIWQYTAIDVASAYTWAFLRSEKRNPSARRTAELCHLVATELKAAGWRLGEVTTDNGSEFRSRLFVDAVEGEAATQRKIKAGRPNSNGCAERVQLTILEECWRQPPGMLLRAPRCVR
ncbi:MAG: helix-turn-helix domain-containing protein [Actinomycetota bacterium]